MENPEMLNMQISKGISEEMKGKYLTYFISGQLFGVSIADVVQIVGMQDITQIPEFPHYAKGIINLRGSIIPVIDMRLRLGKLEKEYDERTCIIITMINEMAVGFIVEAVDAVTVIDDSNISPTPKVTGNEITNAYLTGIAKHEGKVVLIMDTTKILSNDVMQSIAVQD